MFKPAYQGGPYVEVLSPAGSHPLKQWAVSGNKTHCTKIFDKTLKGYAFLLEASAKLGIAKSHLIQPYVAMQVLLPPGQPFTFELSVSDTNNNKRRLFFTNAIKDLRKTPLHVTVPIGSVRRGEWITLLVDVPRIISSSFNDQTFRSLDSLVVSAWCKLRRVFTLKEVDQGSEGMFVDIPGALQLPKAFGAKCIQIIGPHGACDADQYVDIDMFRCHGSAQMNLPSAPALQTKSIAFGTMISVKGPETDGTVSGGILPRTVNVSAKARPNSAVSLPHLHSLNPPASLQTSSAAEQKKRIPILPHIKVSESKVTSEILPPSPPTLSASAIALLGIKAASRPVSASPQSLLGAELRTSPSRLERSRYDPQLYTDPVDQAQNISEEFESKNPEFTEAGFDEGEELRSSSTWGNRATINEDICGRAIQTKTSGREDAVTSTSDNLIECAKLDDNRSESHGFQPVHNNLRAETRSASHSSIGVYASNAVSRRWHKDTQDEESENEAKNFNQNQGISDDMNDPCNWLNGLESRLESMNPLDDRETMHKNRPSSMDSPPIQDRPSTSQTNRVKPLDEKAMTYMTQNDDSFGEDWVTTYDSEMYGGSQMENNACDDGDGERSASLADGYAESPSKKAPDRQNLPICDISSSRSPIHHVRMSTTSDKHNISEETRINCVQNDMTPAIDCEMKIERRTSCADDETNMAENTKYDVEEKRSGPTDIDTVHLVQTTESELVQADSCMSKMERGSFLPTSELFQGEDENVYHDNDHNVIGEEVEAINGTNGETDDEEDEVEIDLVYDSKLNCYYEPSTGKYYEIE